MDLAVHAAVLAALSALLATLSGLVLATLMLRTGLPLSALLLLAGLALPTLLRITLLLLLLARILLFVRHVDVLHQSFRKPPVRRNDNPPSVAWFLPALLELSATTWKIRRKCRSNGEQKAVPRVPRCARSAARRRRF